jgi:hypothetical protein
MVFGAVPGEEKSFNQDLINKQMPFVKNERKEGTQNRFPEERRSCFGINNSVLEKH